MTPIEKGNTHGPDPLYSAALCPLLPEASLDAIVIGVARAAAVDGAAFAEFLQHQKLAPLWDRMLELNPVPAGLLTRDVRDSLSRARVSATEAYVVQQQGLRLSRDILDAAGIAHVVYRGADARERYYAEPCLRPVSRIRLLVSDSSKVEAIKAFGQWGFELQAAQDSVSHRASLTRSKVSIGLQWDLMRPGHTRLPMTEALLATRRDCHSHWGMSDEGNLFTLLVQPVCAGVGTAPPATLLRMVDLARLLARPGLDWDQVVGLLSGAGLKTAAWMTLRHLELLSGSTPAAGIMASLAPGRMRRCLDRRLSGKPALCRQDNARPILPVHDRYGDALHAARRARQLERSREDDLQNLLSAIAVG